MKVRSMRIPEDIARAIDHVARAEKIEKAQSLRKLARLGFEVPTRAKRMARPSRQIASCLRPLGRVLAISERALRWVKNLISKSEARLFKGLIQI